MQEASSGNDGSFPTLFWLIFNSGTDRNKNTVEAEKSICSNKSILLINSTITQWITKELWWTTLIKKNIHNYLGNQIYI